MTSSYSQSQKENFSDEFFVEISIIKIPQAVRIGVRAHDGHHDVFTAAGCGGVLVWSHVRGGEAAAEVSLPSERTLSSSHV